MPELSRFEGIVICMLFKDNKEHNKPHVHVYYGEYSATIGIDRKVLDGYIPRRQLRLVEKWLRLHEEEAYGAWNEAVKGNRFCRIEPLDRRKKNERD